MTEKELFEKLREIASSIMGISLESVLPTSTQDDIPEWDSLGHLRFIMSIEEELNVTFSMMEIPKYKSIEKLIFEIKKQKTIL